MGRVKSRVVCQGNTKTFNCNNSSLAMVIYAATYGRKVEGRTLCPFSKNVANHSMIEVKDTDDKSECPERNVTTDIMKLCDKRTQCIVTANEEYFGNHCKGIYKILNVIYACGEYCITVKYLTIFQLSYAM